MKSPGPESRLVIYIDGASKGNPGRAGAGIWIVTEFIYLPATILLLPVTLFLQLRINT
jgi:hypothetical protein